MMPGIVHIVDDDAFFRTAMECLLTKAGYEVAFHTSTDHLLDYLGTESVVSCIILDVKRRGLSGPDFQQRLNELRLSRPIIFLSDHADVATAVLTIKAGAEDFFVKPISRDELLRAVELAFVRHQTSRDLRNKLDVVRAHIGELTPRERQVFALVIRGKSNKEVARTLGPTERTVKAHRRRVMEKMQVRSLAELVSMAEQVGVLDAKFGF